MINARSETAATSPAFREAFKHRRCVVPVSGFYEWEKLGDERRKQPWYFEPSEGNAKGGEAVFALAGLWEPWKSAAGIELRTFTVLTTVANELLAAMHDRMPVILPSGSIARWLDAGASDVAELLAPLPGACMRSHRVSTWVNAPTHDDARCVEPVEPEASMWGLFG